VKLIGTVAKCLEEHWGVSDKTLAEFVIELCKKSANTMEFKNNLSDNGADSDDAVVESVWKLVHKTKEGKKTDANGTIESLYEEAKRAMTEKDKKFPGLALKNTGN